MPIKLDEILQNIRLRMFSSEDDLNTLTTALSNLYQQQQKEITLAKEDVYKATKTLEQIQLILNSPSRVDMDMLKSEINLIIEQELKELKR
jgi:hypothetical protein